VNEIDPNLTAQSCGRVLIVDDDEMNRRLLSDMLDAAGYTVCTANDGVEALEQAVAFQPEAILLDIMMPRMDGVEACQRLKADPATASIPVLLATALHERADRIRGLAAGANDFLSKPLDVDEVRSRVKNAVYSKKLHDRVQEDLTKLKKLEELRDNLTHMIIHDMRSPLMVVSGSFELVLNEPDGLNASQVDMLKLGDSSCRGVIDMVSSLLDISRMESGQMPINRTLCELDRMAQAAVESMTVLSVEKGQTLRVTGTAARCHADHALLDRVFVNLLGNAIKFTPDGGTIEVNVVMAEGKVRCEVRDSGKEIPRQYQKRIFEKFGQVESRKEGKMNSTGLGLTFCRLAVEAHGGQIGVVSSAGKGNTFWFTLPVGEERREKRE